MHWFVGHWGAILNAFWESVTRALGIAINKKLYELLSILIFYAGLSYGTVLLAGHRRRHKKPSPFQGNILALVLISVYFSAPYLLAQKSAVAWLTLSCFITTLSFSEGSILLRVYAGILCSAMFVLLHRYIFESLRFLDSEKFGDAAFIVIAMIFFVPLIYVPTRALTKRIFFMLIGIALIFGLSEASKLVEKLRTAATTVETH